MTTVKQLISVRREMPERIASPEKRREAAELFKRGLSHRRVAEELGLSEYTVRDWHRAFRKGEFRIDVSDSLRSYDVETKQEAIRLRRSGLCWKDFEEETGIPRSTCLKWMAEAEQHAE